MQRQSNIGLNFYEAFAFEEKSAKNIFAYPN